MTELWMLGVLGHGGGSTPLVAVQPLDDDLHEQIATRLRRGGWRRVSAAEWSRQAWPVAPAGAVDVVGGQLVRITTGTASLYCADDFPLTPMWISAGRERRALVALVPPGTYTEDEASAPEPAVDLLGQAAAARRLLAALAVVRFDVFTGPRPSHG